MTGILDLDYIAFPGLGIDHLNIDRVAFTVFGQPIYWYGVLITLGFILALVYGLKTAKRHRVKTDDLIDMVLVGVPSCIICARAFYVLMRLDYYKSFREVIDIRSGGLAIYGAVIGAIIVVLVMSKIKKINPGAILDIASLGFLLAQAIGRWGNFVNREAFGTVTNMPWAMEIYDASAGARTLVHPTFLYESLWNIIGFAILHFYSKKKKFSGEIFLMYMAWYGVGRAVVEGLRTDSLYLGGTGIRVSQLLGAVFFIVSVVLIIIMRYKVKRGPIQTEYKPIYEGIKEEDEGEGAEDVLEKTKQADHAGQNEEAEGKAQEDTPTKQEEGGFMPSSSEKEDPSDGKTLDAAGETAAEKEVLADKKDDNTKDAEAKTEEDKSGKKAKEDQGRI